MFNERLRKIRKDRGLSLQQAANGIGIQKTLLHKYETATVSPSMKNLMLMAEYYKCGVDHLIYGSNVEPQTYFDFVFLKASRNIQQAALKLLTA